MYEVNMACGRSTGHVQGQQGMWRSTGHVEVNRACGRSTGHVGGQHMRTNVAELNLMSPVYY